MMTPLERARQEKQVIQQCSTCANCVEIDGVQYCEVNGKILLDIFTQIGRCLHKPSDWKKKENL